MRRLTLPRHDRRHSAHLRVRPSLTRLEDRTTPAAVLVTAADAGGGPHVIVRADSNGDGTADTITASFFAFDPTFAGGVRVAMGDFDGDGRDELVTAAGPGGGPHVKVWKLDANGAVTDLLDSFFAFDISFLGGVWVAAGDINRDGKDELIVAADAGGGPHVKIYSDTNGDGRLSDNLVDSFFAFDPAFRGGVRIAVIGSPFTDEFLVAAAGPGGGPHVKVYDNRNRLSLQVSDEVVMHEFMAFDPSFRGGVFVTTSRIRSSPPSASNFFAVSAGAGGGPHVKLFRASTSENFPPIPPGQPSQFLSLELRDSFFAYEAGFTGGVRMAFSDLAPNDPSVDLVTAPGLGAGSQVKIWQQEPGTGQVSNQPLADIFAAFTTPDGQPLDIGVFVAFGIT